MNAAKLIEDEAEWRFKRMKAVAAAIDARVYKSPNAGHCWDGDGPPATPLEAVSAVALAKELLALAEWLGKERLA